MVAAESWAPPCKVKGSNTSVEIKKLIVGVIHVVLIYRAVVA